MLECLLDLWNSTEKVIYQMKSRFNLKHLVTGFRDQNSNLVSTNESQLEFQVYFVSERTLRVEVDRSALPIFPVSFVNKFYLN